MSRSAALFLWLLISVPVVSANSHFFPKKVEVVFADGIRVELAAWQQQFPEFEGETRLECRFDLPSDLSHIEQPALLVSMLASFEAEWDGVSVGRNGVTGSDRTGEIPGRLVSILPLPREMVGPGEHRLVLRTSNFHGDRKARIYALAVGDLEDSYNWRRGRAAFFMGVVGFFCAIAFVYLLFHFLAERRAAYVVFGLLCLAVAALLAMEYLRMFVNYAYPFHFVRLRIIVVLTALCGQGLIWFCMLRFNLSGKVRVLGLSGLLMVVGFFLFPGYDGKSAFMMIAALLITLAVLAVPLRSGEPGAKAVTGGVLWCLAPVILSLDNFMDHGFFIAFVGLILVLLIELALHAHRQAQRFRQAELRSEILKQELLKKHIQPHFLMNTLTSVQEWIEEHPATGVRMIEALAEEFRIFSGIVDCKLIPVDEELALCRAHLETMSFTLEKTLELVTDGIDPQDEVPPGLLHTLVENALTHGDLGGEGPLVTVHRDQTAHGTRFRVFSPVSLKPGARTSHGTGLAYVKARLEESFPGNWRLEAGIEAGRWCTEMTWRKG